MALRIVPRDNHIEVWMGSYSSPEFQWCRQQFGYESIDESRWSWMWADWYEIRGDAATLFLLRWARCQA